MRLLLVEDNRELSDWLARLLRKSHYVVDCVFNGEDADHAALSEDYALMIVDVGLPGIDGMEVVRRVRARGQNLPILMLTAIDTVTSRVRGLDLGADDYLVKPFDIDELEARIRVQVRRHGGSKTTTITFGDLSFDTNARQFLLGGAPLDLTKREHSVLEALMLRAGTTILKAALADKVFGYEDEAAPNALEVYVHRLRKKLEAADVNIVTLRGLGYVLRKNQDGPKR